MGSLPGGCGKGWIWIELPLKCLSQWPSSGYHGRRSRSEFQYCTSADSAGILCSAGGKTNRKRRVESHSAVIPVAKTKKTRKERRVKVIASFLSVLEAPDKEVHC